MKITCPPPTFLQCSRNSRELGGIPAGDGRIIRSSRLFRSGQLSALSDLDEKRVRIHGITDIVDFRSDVEREEKPDRIPDGLHFHTLPVVNRLIPGITRESIEDPYKAFSRKDYASELGGRGMEVMCSLYPILIEEEQAIRCYRQFFRILLDAEGGVIWHCAMGKDRAGVATALVLTSLGVSYPEILQDYLYTGICCAEEIRAMTEACRDFTDDPVILQSVFWLNTTHRSYLDAAFASMTEMGGSPMGYLREIIGLRDTDLNRMKKKYLL